MPSHWTYGNFMEEDDLLQGDILTRTPELIGLFREIHPHFCHEKYLGFMVMSQSCDLVKRGEVCSSPHINLAAIKPLSSILHSLIGTVCEPVSPGVFSEKQRNKANDLLARIFNQNEQKLGLFYLFPEADIGLAEDSVVLLRICIAFRSEHYDIFRQSRRGRLEMTFSNKLGWLMGNLYSRIGTKDWPKDSLQQKINEHINGSSGDHLYWARENAIEHLKKEGFDFSAHSAMEAIDKLKKAKPTSPKVNGIKRIIELLREFLPDGSEHYISKIEKQLLNDPALGTTFRQN
jgi:hypothetical protein